MTFSWNRLFPVLWLFRGTLAFAVFAAYLLLTSCQNGSVLSSTRESLWQPAPVLLSDDDDIAPTDELSRAGYGDYEDYLDHGAFVTERQTLGQPFPGDSPNNPLVSHRVVRDGKNQHYQSTYFAGGR